MRTLRFSLATIGALLVICSSLQASNINPVDVRAPFSTWSYSNGTYSTSDSTSYAFWTMKSAWSPTTLIGAGGFGAGSNFSLNATFSTTPVSGQLAPLSASLNFTGITSTVYGNFGTLSANTSLLRGYFDLQKGKVDLLFSYKDGNFGIPGGLIEVVVAPTNDFTGLSGNTAASLPLSATGTYHGLAQTDVIAVPAPAAFVGGVFLLLGLFVARKPWSRGASLRL